jgi:putative flippase GtrA
MDNKNTIKLSRKQNIIQFFKFTAFSCTAGLVQIISFTLLNELTDFPYWPSYLIALILSVLYNFTVNRRYTFKSANNIPKAMFLVALYYCAFTPLSTLWGEYLTNAGWNYYVVLFGTMIINFVTEFLFDRFVVFKNSIYTNKLAQKEIEECMYQND